MSPKNAILIPITLCAVIVFSSCRSNIKIEEDKNNELLVQVYSDSILPLLEQQYTAYDLRKEKTVSRPMKIHLYTFNSGKIADTTLLRMLKKSEHIKEAQINHKVETRNK